MSKHIFIRGNSKLGKDVLVFNIPPGGKAIGGTCRPTAWCNKNCYAMKGLHLFPSVKKANQWRYQLSLQDDFVDLAIAELNRTTKAFVRIHSSGDFYSEEYVNKWMKICGECKDKRFLAYTKSRHLIEPLKKLAQLPNVVIYESLDSSRPKAITPHLLRAYIEDSLSEKAAKKRARETISCPGECGPCDHKCWDGDKHVVFHKH